MLRVFKSHYRINAGRPPTRDPVAHNAYLKGYNRALRRRLIETERQLADARAELAATRKPLRLVPSGERQRRLAAWFAKRAARAAQAPHRRGVPQ